MVPVEAVRPAADCCRVLANQKGAWGLTGDGLCTKMSKAYGSLLEDAALVGVFFTTEYLQPPLGWVTIDFKFERNKELHYTTTTHMSQQVEFFHCLIF